MKTLSRKVLLSASAVTLALFTLIFLSARSTWITAGEISDNHASYLLQRDEFPVNARTALLQMNNLLLLREIRKDQVLANRSEFEDIANHLKLEFQRELILLQETARRTAVTKLQSDFDRYLEAANSFMNENRETLSLAERLEDLHHIHDLGNDLIQSLNILSEARTNELEATFLGYKSSHDKQTYLLFLLVSFALLLIGVSVFIFLQNRVAGLRLELSRSKLSQERQEKLASLGTLASGVAHEIRNPLTAIKARLFALERKIPPESEATLQAREIGREIDRLEKIVKEFLLFARPPKPMSEVFKVLPVLEQVCNLLEKELDAESIRINITASEQLHAKGDPEQLRQILINLIQNAADASKNGDSITIDAYQQDGSAKPRQVAIDIIDEGSGIAEQQSRKLFTPFYTTKAKGTGLGLSIAKRIAQAQKGDLVFKSQYGTGTTFTITIPAAD